MKHQSLSFDVLRCQVITTACSAVGHCHQHNNIHNYYVNVNEQYVSVFFTEKDHKCIISLCSANQTGIAHHCIGWLGSRVVSMLDSAQKGLGSNRSHDAVGNSLRQTVHTVYQAAKIGSSPLKGCEDNCRPGKK